MKAEPGRANQEPEIKGAVPMGVKAKNNPPRKRGPKPEVPVVPRPWDGNIGKGLNKPPSKGFRPQPPSKKGRGGR
jgi:hypothetical protein